MEQPNTTTPSLEMAAPSSAMCNLVPEFDDPRRAEIISQIGSGLCIDEVNPSIRALLWLADVEALRALSEECKKSPGVFRLLFVQGADAFKDALEVWRDSVSETWDDGGDGLRDPCEERDGSCVITREDGGIRWSSNAFPHPLEAPGQAEESAMLWDIIGMFWSGPRVAFWRQAAISCGCTDGLENGILMCQDAGTAWANLRFALKPLKLSQDCRSLTVQIYRLPGQTYSAKVPLVSRPDIDRASNNWLEFTGRWSKTMIRSGDIVCLLTKDPKKLPLPSFQLLEMQWYLHRAAALSGLASPPRP